MGWRSWLSAEDAHGVATFEVVARPPGSTAYQPVSPAVSFEAAWRKAGAAEGFSLGAETRVFDYSLYADPPARVRENQGVRAAGVGTLNVVYAAEERDAQIVILRGKRVA